jgi:hypothetical protein
LHDGHAVFLRSLKLGGKEIGPTKLEGSFACLRSLRELADPSARGPRREVAARLEGVCTESGRASASLALVEVALGVAALAT